MIDSSYLAGLVVLFTQWPVVVPALAVCLYMFFRNVPANVKTAERFFKNFYIGGHRGSPIRQPENTIASFVQAKTEGADLIEFDVSLTKDGVAVLLHDDTLDRTTNLTGPIRNVLFKDLTAVNCAAKFVIDKSLNSHTVERVLPMPTMRELVKWAKDNNMKMLFDVKDTDQELVDQIRDLFDEYDLFELGIVCSFFPQVVYRIKKMCPKVLTGLTWRRWMWSYADLAGTVPRFNGALHYIAMLVDVIHVWSIKTWMPSFLGVDMILTERSEISETFVAQQRANNRYVCAWTVNDLNELNWMRNTLSIPVLTDKPYLIEQVAKMSDSNNNKSVCGPSSNSTTAAA